MFARFVKNSVSSQNVSADQWFTLSKWYKTNLGVCFEQEEKLCLDRNLKNLFGYHLLQVGQLGQLNWHENSRVSHCVTMNQQFPVELNNEKHENLKKQNNISMIGSALELPVQSASVDVLILPHLLEFSNNPHEVLREAERALIPEGYLILLAFNPVSFWSLFRWLLMWKHEVPWRGRFFSKSRVKDWLALLGFDNVQCESYFFRPPMQHNSFMTKFKFLEHIGKRFWPALGGGFILVAKKRVNTFTPIKPRWKSRKIVTAGLEPSNKTSSLKNNN
ncbi:FIG005121: SAM-dependent methyltransferase [hydrothermal vent metagenome]|uniref:FIG005121: SAM-dependent methyltransferase n=1 Tax=hydrothermal vent metagenome TaxID=652676 RepID=A0A3B0ZV58_9ZZZZ